MKHIEKDIRSRFTVTKNPKVKGWWMLKYDGHRMVEQSSPRGWGLWIESTVKMKLRDIKKAAALLRHHGWLVEPPSKRAR